MDEDAKEEGEEGGEGGGGRGCQGVFLQFDPAPDGIAVVGGFVTETVLFVCVCEWERKRENE